MVFSSLSLLRGEPYNLNDKITIYQPTIGDIEKFGETEYYGVASLITAVPYDFKVPLDDAGIDYEEVSDFELFRANASNITPEQTKLIFGENFNLSNFSECISPKTEQCVLYDEKTDTVIDEVVYLTIVEYVRKIHYWERNNKRAGNKRTKEFLIEEERQKLKMQGDNFKDVNMLEPLITSLVNCRDFKYSYSECWDLTVYQLLNSYMQIQTFLNYNNLATGIYTGNIELDSKIKRDFNWVKKSGD